MKELSGSASGVAPAPVEESVRFLRAVDRYPTWHPEVVHRVEVLERDGDGNPTLGRAMLHVTLGPLAKDFDLVLLVTLEDPQTVKLTRVPNDTHDAERFAVTWRAEPGERGERTRIRLELEAILSVPRLVPVTGVGDRMAHGFVSAATQALGA